ncbi:MAG: response regulator transcription factor [Anaerolineales bacterium]|jgi:DNA-binding NarL/FixJ family response regulator
MSQRIFLADDELNVRQALRLLLEQAGFTVVGEACNAESLQNQVCASPLDVILIDWELPGLKAQHFMTTIRGHCPETKVIALSARPDARPSALAVGVDAFVSKGHPSDELLAALRSITMEVT